MNCPNRVPDYKNEFWAVWFDEMIIFGRGFLDHNPPVAYKMEERHDGVYVIDFAVDNLPRDIKMTNEAMIKAYNEWLIEKQLLR